MTHERLEEIKKHRSDLTACGSNAEAIIKSMDELIAFAEHALPYVTDAELEKSIAQKLKPVSSPSRAEIAMLIYAARFHYPGGAPDTADGRQYCARIAIENADALMAELLEKNNVDKITERKTV